MLKTQYWKIDKEVYPLLSIGFLYLTIVLVTLMQRRRVEMSNNRARG